MNQNRQIVLDTETTGIDPRAGHRVIEIGCVELINRKLTGNHFHVYINPQRHVEQEAIDVHGITNEFLADKPTYQHVHQDFVDFIKGAELVIHNAPFDVGFMNHEFAMLNPVNPVVTENICSVLDTLALAKKMHPGQKNNLDALCRRYGIDNSHRDLHGALLDAEILADVYLMMTGGQTSLNLGADANGGQGQNGDQIARLSEQRRPLKVIKANQEELDQHLERLEVVKKQGGSCIWLD